MPGIGCHNDPPRTGIRVEIKLGDRSFDQLIFSVSNSDRYLVDHEPRPAVAGRPLVGDQVVEIYLDGRGGSNVTLDVVGVLGNNPPVMAKVNRVELRAKIMVTVIVDLGGAATDGGLTNVDRRDTSIDGSDAGSDDAPDADAAVVSDVGPGDVLPSGAPLGTACSSPDTCESGVCVDGVCCASTCGACQGCNVSGKAGTCTFVPAGLPYPTCLNQGIPCGFNGTCDGNGKCYRPPAGTMCKPAACQGATLTPPAACDGIDACLVPVNVNCGPFLCDPTGGPHCRTTCSSGADCVPSAQCNNASCGPRPRKGNGAGCVADAECVSNFCTDGVCCDARCDAGCLACNQAGQLGMCLNVPADRPDPHNICKDTGVAGCGTNGQCNGSGACARYPVGTVCQDAQCLAHTVIGARHCDQNGMCGGTDLTECARYRCNPATAMCFTSCTTAAECAKDDMKACRPDGTCK